jgi:predicted short-subunit dehydrogenase-like oxidoreductase (DUF2520 family)
VRVCIVGRGKVGHSLSRALADASVRSRDRGRASTEHVLIAAQKLPEPFPVAQLYVLAVPDARIREVAAELSERVERGCCVVHCAGARDVSELAPLSARGVHVGVLHPLVSFASARGGTSLGDSTFTTFGDVRATAAARRLCKLLGARCVRLDAAPGPAYHAAAALVANGTAALTHAGVRILCELGFSRRAAERALASLLTSVAVNVREVGVPAALTGPVVRGDVATIERHLAALGALDRGLRRTYAALQPVIVDSALEAGLPTHVARRIRRATAPDTHER